MFAGAPGHDQSGRFVPFWHRYGGRIRLEANIDYDKPEADWYLARRPPKSGSADRSLRISSRRERTFHHQHGGADPS